MERSIEFILSLWRSADADMNKEQWNSFWQVWNVLQAGEGAAVAEATSAKR